MNETMDTRQRRHGPRTVLEIDFGSLYREHMEASGGREKPPEAWDARAAEYSRKSSESEYTGEFVKRMDISQCRTLLDVGCGPGTIALAVADRLERVYALDYSRAMLQALEENAALRGIKNVQTILRSWDDDWSAVPECDMVVASRSTLVRDMAQALKKLDGKARRRVHLTSLAGGQFLAPEVLEAIGRKRPAFPDYIYIINILYQMGRSPRLDYIRTARKEEPHPNFDTFLRRVEFSLGPLSGAERNQLASWHSRSPDLPETTGTEICWAFISWETRDICAAIPMRIP